MAGAIDARAAITGEPLQLVQAMSEAVSRHRQFDL